MHNIDKASFYEKEEVWKKKETTSKAQNKEKNNKNKERSIGNIKTLNKEQLNKYSKIEFVVHPLYHFVFERMRENNIHDKSFTEKIKNKNISFEEIALDYLNMIISNSKDDEDLLISKEYIALMEILEEIGDYRRTNDKNKLRIFFLPNIWDWLNQNQIDLMNKFLEQYADDNTYILNSSEATNWVISYEDMSFLWKNLAEKTNVEIQWWYMSWCLDDAIESFKEINLNHRKDQIEINIDVKASTDPWLQSGYEIMKWNKEFNKALGINTLPDMNIPENFNSIDEALVWLKNDALYLEFKKRYDKKVWNSYKETFDIESAYE